MAGWRERLLGCVWITRISRHDRHDVSAKDSVKRAASIVGRTAVFAFELKSKNAKRIVGKTNCTSGVCYTGVMVIRPFDRGEHVSGNTRLRVERTVRKGG